MLGFDIRPGAQGEHWVDGVLYPIWGNSVGCFDAEPEDGEYVYLAGDSFTWGYAPYEAKFGSLLEERSGVQVLACGVEHTGQRHQFEKMVRTVERMGRDPRALIVMYFENDVANDYSHPHSTVIDGWLVDAAFLDPENEVVRPRREELAARLHAQLARYEDAPPPERSAVRTVKGWLKRYSLSASLVNALIERGEVAAGAMSTSTPEAPRSIYNTPYGGALSYRENPYAEANQDALLAFRDWTTERGVSLVVALIPRLGPVFDERRYAEVRDWLTAHGIRHLDLTVMFAAHDLDPSTLYWRGDSHFNPQGNEQVAELLLEAFPELFSSEPVSLP